MGDEIQVFYKAGIAIAQQAGELVKEEFYKNKAVEEKANYADLVTETDQAVEKLIIDTLSAAFPSHKFIGEESVASGKGCVLTEDPTWIIDPIDGTTNFVHSIPQTSISIGLAINKEIVVGIVFCPILNEMYSAVKGQGAFCNDIKLQVSKIQELKRSVVILEGGSQRDAKVMEDKMYNMQKILSNSHGIRSYGSAAFDLCAVARGLVEAYVEHGLHVWDYAAGKLIVEEAGGVITDPCGEPVDMFSRRVLAACSPSVGREISRLTRNIELERD